MSPTPPPRLALTGHGVGAPSEATASAPRDWCWPALRKSASGTSSFADSTSGFATGVVIGCWDPTQISDRLLVPPQTLEAPVAPHCSQKVKGAVCFLSSNTLSSKEALTVCGGRCQGVGEGLWGKAGAWKHSTLQNQAQSNHKKEQSQTYTLSFQSLDYTTHIDSYQAEEGLYLQLADKTALSFIWDYFINKQLHKESLPISSYKPFSLFDFTQELSLYPLQHSTEAVSKSAASSTEYPSFTDN